jgi:hypothetical protein
MSSTGLIVIRSGEEHDARCVTVKKIFPCDGADFPLSEKPGDRDWSKALLYDSAVMMSMAEQPFASTAATEEEGAQRRIPVL